MAKREQLVAEELKEQQPAQEVEKEMRSIAQAYAAYEQLMDEIRDCSQQAKELREQAAELQRSGRIDFHVREEIQKLLNRAEHLDAVADWKDGLLRQQVLLLIDSLEREASDWRQLVQYNQAALEQQQQELEDAKAAAVKMVQEAEEYLERSLALSV
ncbi:hypothetical protein ACWHAM_26365 [Paenibacillus terrae]